ncbi:hypothetical protein A8F94_17235 [Bacillus sp. FJAT-27225]|uniref:hypothetical protein n=1 Tax=Bacillus sp. FJAT-27225 TaxID=1743144 RepID=UPI00080C32CD|nr:hypothetical protein [Bacillus sp. FJAT-27225]OCA84442.1 hypothetical protein A8F94_17235 [Bacillus sp. FJAT-27225]
MLTELFIHLAVPIEQPPEQYLGGFRRKDPEPFMFDQQARFTLYERVDDGPKVLLARDNYNKWYFLTFFTSSNLAGLKWARQSVPPSYMEEDLSLPLYNLLEEEGLQAANPGFDKAFAHVGVLTDKLSNVNADTQARLANVDGDDDPTVVTNIHFVRNMFKGMETRYVAGVETHSFATITENEQYFKEVHLKSNAYLYLLYFIYFIHYQIVPSMQMVPRLLGNLWASRQVFNGNFNPSLFVSEPLDNQD